MATTMAAAISHTPRSSLAMDTTLISRDQLVPRLPVELERDIFELTARTHRETAVRLTLVARRVQIWVERVIYQVISLSSPKKCSHFLKTLESRPKAFFQSHVQAICLPYYLDIEQATRILAVCVNVENLACWACRPPLPLPLPHAQASSPLSAILIGAAVGGIAAGRPGSPSLYQCLVGLGHEIKTSPRISNGSGIAAQASNGRKEHDSQSHSDSASRTEERERWERNNTSPSSPSQPTLTNGSGLYIHESWDNGSNCSKVMEDDGEEDMIPRPHRLSINIGDLFQPATLPRTTPLPAPIPGNQLLTNIPTTPTHLQININSNISLGAGAGPDAVPEIGTVTPSTEANDYAYPDFTLPLFCKLTHLRIIDGWTSWITFCHLLCKIPKLTHLALDCSGLMVGGGGGAGGAGMQGIERVVGSIGCILGLRSPEENEINDTNTSADPTTDANPDASGTCTNLKILVLSINRFEKPEVRRALEALMEEDERVVVMDYENPMVNWQKGVGVKPGVCQWTLAECIFEGRRKRD